MSAHSYFEAWRPITARIHGLEKASEIHARFLTVHSGSPYGADKALQKHCEDILIAIEKFQESFEDIIPVEAKLALHRFMEDGGKNIRDNTNGDKLLFRTIIVKLVAFESEMTYYLDSSTERVRSASELAFMHLRRLIIVDTEYQKQWQDAFEKHETHCERLGALHLLWHGIWAFKVDATGGKTDLVFQEPIQFDTESAKLGIVLTEWKRSINNPEDAYAIAKQQASLYSSEIIGGMELASHRYLIVVTRNQIVPPMDLVEGDITYRHINIAVEPQAPSLAAKKIIK